MMKKMKNLHLKLLINTYKYKAIQLKLYIQF